MNPKGKRNFAKELDELIARESQSGHMPRLLLHVCCAPCASPVLERLAKSFHLILLFYNPNIEPQTEYERRRDELEKLLVKMSLSNSVSVLPGFYRGEDFKKISKGMETEPEGGERCLRCYRLRLEEAAKAARELSCDYFTTTLSLSPLKNAQLLNEIGEELARTYGVSHLPCDFKKREGYKRSLELSREYDLYRQDYCGCSYSKWERMKEKEEEGKNGSVLS